MTKFWYYHEDPNGSYYTLTAKVKKVYTALGDGGHVPTPAQIKAYLDENPDAYFDDGGLMYENNKEETTHQPVDLPGGFYNHEPRCPYSGSPERLIPITVRNDTVVLGLEDFDKVIAEINDFMSEEAKAIDKELNISHRHGILLYGPAGCGKTTMLRSILKDTVPKETFIIFMDKLFSNDMIKKLKISENERFKVLVFEEMVTTVENVKIDALLDFLDGERSLDNTLVFGTTNYPEKLPANIVDRPGRFDSIHKIDVPSKSSRTKLLAFYLSRDPSEEEVSDAKDLSAAALKELCLVMRRKKQSMKVSLVAIKKHRELVKKAFAESRPMGLSGRGGRDDDDDY